MIDSNKKTVLIVDDETDILEIIQNCLANLGVNILVATDGKQAIELIEKYRPDTVISDIAMPNLDGFALLSKIKVTYQEIPVIMLTSYGDRENILQALRLGALDFLEKPFSREDLLTVAGRALEIGIRAKRMLESNREVSGEIDLKTRAIQNEHDRKMIGLFTVKNNRTKKTG
jgi:DNA-binding NtrC family response regulator